MNETTGDVIHCTRQRYTVRSFSCPPPVVGCATRYRLRGQQRFAATDLSWRNVELCINTVGGTAGQTTWSYILRSCERIYFIDTLPYCVIGCVTCVFYNAEGQRYIRGHCMATGGTAWQHSNMRSRVGVLRRLRCWNWKKSGSIRTASQNNILLTVLRIHSHSTFTEGLLVSSV